MIREYKKKPVVIKAVMWDNQNSTFKLIKSLNKLKRKLILDGDILKIETLEGMYSVDVGDYVIQGIKGELYPCKPDIFKLTYEELNAGFDITAEYRKAKEKWEVYLDK